mmetsp:Transcript_48474/g.113458  ORF Transcript_48474/g.113458 Transcript_48474/m.113458 type:complete len:228 (+) Transcript_48474:783-1466(+)
MSCKPYSTRGCVHITQVEGNIAGCVAICTSKGDLLPYVEDLYVAYRPVMLVVIYRFIACLVLLHTRLKVILGLFSVHALVVIVAELHFVVPLQDFWIIADALKEKWRDAFVLTARFPYHSSPLFRRVRGIEDSNGHVILPFEPLQGILHAPVCELFPRGNFVFSVAEPTGVDRSQAILAAQLPSVKGPDTEACPRQVAREHIRNVRLASSRHAHHTEHHLVVGAEAT